MTDPKTPPESTGSTQAGSDDQRSQEQSWLEDLYQQASSENPPEELDRQILRSAHDSVRHPLLQRKAWHAPFLYGTAASALLTVLVWLQFDQATEFNVPQSLETHAVSVRPQHERKSPELAAESPESAQPVQSDSQTGGFSTPSRLAAQKISAPRSENHSEYQSAQQMTREIQNSAAIEEIIAPKQMRAPTWAFDAAFAAPDQMDHLTASVQDEILRLDVTWGGSITCTSPFVLPAVLAVSEAAAGSATAVTEEIELTEWAATAALLLHTDRGDLVLYCAKGEWQMVPLLERDRAPLTQAGQK